MGYDLKSANSTVRKSYSILGEIIVPLNSGYFLFNSIFPRGFPTTKGSLKITSTLIENSNSSTSSELIIPPKYNIYSLNVSFRSC